MTRQLWIFLIAASAFSACHSRESLSSQGTATVKIANFIPNASLAEWTEMTLKAEQRSPQEKFSESKFNRALFLQSSQREVNVTLDYGEYQLKLEYRDPKGELLFQSCADEAERLHILEQSVYYLQTTLCSAVDQMPVGSISVQVPASTAEENPTSQTSKQENPLMGKFWVDPDSQAQQDLRSLADPNSPEARLIRQIADQPMGVWYGEWSGPIGPAVKKHVEAATAQDANAIIVPYYIPYRDCGQHSAGGAELNTYRTWITELAQAIGTAKAVVILEPDALALNGCLTEELKRERNELLRYAVSVLKANPKTRVYIDAGHPAWLSADEAASRLSLAGIDQADGFALNVGNFQTTDANIRYGQQVRSRLGNKTFVVDTSRNGKGPATDGSWCNPRGRAIGPKPNSLNGIYGLDAILWIKRPGESDGICNGGPSAGAWWRDLALELVTNAGL